MKKFTKGALETIVDDDDRRIPEYLANGWKEAPLPKKPQDAADEQLDKAMTDVENSEGGGTKKGSKKPAKKVNDAIKANTAAAAESEAVDDGLIKKEGE